MRILFFYFYDSFLIAFENRLYLLNLRLKTKPVTMSFFIDREET